MTLARRVALASSALIVCAVLATGAFGYWLTRYTYLRQIEAALTAEATVTASEAAPAVRTGQAEALQSLATRVGTSAQVRVTIVAADGRVLGDSVEAPPVMDNHAGRPEVATALAGEVGVSRRQSDTLHAELMYVAVPVKSDGRVVGVARAAVPVRGIDANVGTLFAVMGFATVLAALVGAAVTAGLARVALAPVYRLTAAVTRMARGDLDDRVPVSRVDEVGELGLAFNSMADRVRSTIEQVSEERNRLSAIIDTVPDGLVIVDAERSILQINPAAARLLNCPAAQAVGKSFGTVSRDAELTSLVEVGAAEPRLIELGIPTRQVRALVATVAGPDGQRVVLLQDVTEVRRLENVRRDFAANVSHELRTPLAAMRAIVETLEDSALDDPSAARQFLGRLREEVDELSALVQQLLELSRIESGRAELHARPLAIEEIVTASTERLVPLAERSGLTLTVDSDRPLPRVVADPERVRQVLANLIHNAIKFTPPGGHVTVGAHRGGNDHEGEIVVHVSDSGVGIPSGDLDRVFERFYKTDRSRGSAGTGLGLAIAKHLVQAQGGRIWAQSGAAERPGATFSFTLPLADESADD
ncbi:MAG: ATP-binding protein [Chloroflexota bacterium]